MANYFKQVLGYKSTEQPDDAMERGRIACSPSLAMETLQPGVAEVPVIVRGSTALPSFSFKGPSPTSKVRYTTPPKNTSLLFPMPLTRTNMGVDGGPHGLRRPSEEPATPGNKVRVVESNSPLGYSVGLVVFFLVVY
jgi:hypothetical protein